MGNYGDNRYGGDRWRERDQGNWNRDRDYGRGDNRSQSGRGGYGGNDDRGFFDRAGDEVRSWFGDDEAQRRREEDERRWAREQGMTGRRDNDDGDRGAGSLGGGGFGSGWGNQRGESWNRERPGERGWFDGSSDRESGRGEREGWFSDSRGGERGNRYGGAGGGYGSESGYGGYGGESGGSSRYGATSGREGGGQSGGGGRSSGSHDPHYSEWRQRQIEDLDRDYDEYRREHQSKFEIEFGSWRSKRQTQRQSLNKVSEHMEVVGSDGSHVGTVDKVRGDRIILTKSDSEAGGIHHSIPCSWIESIEDKVKLNKSADDARDAWRTEERSRALFEREDQGSEGPGILNRSFSGTYGDQGDNRKE